MSAFSALEKYLPEGTLSSIELLIKNYSVIIRIKDERKSKFGDYRPLRSKWKHQITINNNLNPYAFLVTLLHEIAHMQVFEKYGRKAKPHGSEWQMTYSSLLKNYIGRNIFPHAIEHVLQDHVFQPTASSCTDVRLYKALKTADIHPPTHIHVEDIPEGEYFVWNSNRIFRRENKLRTRYKCIEMKTGRIYFFHPLAEVEKAGSKKDGM